VSDVPYWFRSGSPLAGFQSNADLPATADVVIIGAGLIGASAAYHLADAANARSMRIVVLDRGDPAGEASGRNGGNFELIPENSVGVYEGLARERLAFLRRLYRDLPREVLRAESERQASLVLGIALRNRDLLSGIVMRERIDCDFSPRGWLHLASSEKEEQGICEEVMLAAQHGQRIELWSRGKIRREMGIETGFLGRFIPGDGTYHPFKYVCGVLRSAVARGVELYTRTPVLAVRSEDAARHRIVTARGTITAGRVIVATNAFTAALFPELNAIRPHQSQIQVTEGAPDRARGRVVTCEVGPVFFNQPRDGARRGRAPLLMGGGRDRPMRDPSARAPSKKVHARLLALRDRFYPELHGRALSAEWVGPMAFTPDQLPAIGPLRAGVIIAMGCNGYGGSYTTAAGLAAAEMALTGRVPDWMPEDVFSPRRLTMTAPIFMSQRDSLWRIASSLCKQLAAVNRRISDALSLYTGPVDDVRVRRSQMMMAVAKSESAATMPPTLLRSLPLFKAFTGAELDSMQRAMRRWEVRKGTLLFAEGSAGGSCFVLVKGEVEVSLEVHGRHQLLARLSAGSIFGQVSLISGEPRSATCTISRDAVLVELERADCETLLDARSPLSLKLLGVLNDGIIAALRVADRRIMKLESGEGGVLEGDLPAPLEGPAVAPDVKERIRSRARIVRADEAEA
jgi:glycine/D-amino acid oxidase-like deaminating enzyme/CRP-like cAMP-binding protein